MRIIFICGSLKPGYDGVGDYTIRLCGEISRKGHKTGILALNDRFANTATAQTLVTNGTEVEAFRIPNEWSQAQRFQKASKWVAEFAPDWLSLQYVPYSFSKLGIPLQLASKLKKLSSLSKWHVMVHEPFLAYPQSGIKNKCVRLLQKLSVRFLQKKLHPHFFSTTIIHYQNMLAGVSIRSTILGLFGNLDVLDGDNGEKRYPSSEEILKGVFFGAAPPAQQHKFFAEQINRLSKLSGKKVVVNLCGRSGDLGRQFAETIGNTCSANLCQVNVLGILEPAEISHQFSSADFGIARVPPRLIGKSGAAISMLEHGLPLWIPMSENENDTNYLDFRPELCYNKIEDLITIEGKRTTLERLPLIAAQLLADFEPKK